ncbi:hypothetical protein IC582_007212 [Cucumis melo]|uniref:U11/U12 small nuclear ribonucleoprotein 25 kDa protein-like n=1 Tax=Cucumis melo var. makuwa TaxID=1194695 RepID=A0A5A7T9I3_CUCMM|nr:U11/U12 small nuclear ribonucleoprotein 25 kDa protein-like [Cucumis melo var. makuwa]
MAVDGVCTLDVVDFPPPTSTTTAEKHRRSFSLLSSPLMIVGLSRKNVLYRQLPHQPLMLSVLKLDGSCFDIQVRRSATVAELKGAVELVFSHMPQNGPGKISWLHVWWHFCLCYDGQKLIDDADYIASFGIKDGDQLQFVRHVTTGYNVIRKQSKKREVSSKLISRISSRSKSFKQNDQKDMERYNYKYNDIESGRCQHNGNNDLFVNQPKMVVFLGGWFSHTKLASAGKMSIKSLVRPSVTRPSLVGGLKNLIQLCREKRHYEKVNKKKRSIIGV